MEQRLRYTGSWPPPDILSRYPNWVFALDEEGLEGQDETTIKPQDYQEYVSDETDFTAADVRLAAGQARIGIIRLEEGVPSALDVFEQGNWWTVQQGPGKRWETVKETWMPEGQRRPTVSLNDHDIFPLTVKSRLPRYDGAPLHFSVGPNGKVELRKS